MGTTTAARHYATTNPYTGETVREFDSLSREQLDRAVAAAGDAFGGWRRRPISERPRARAASASCWPTVRSDSRAS